jgi:hypothetical protein
LFESFSTIKNQGLRPEMPFLLSKVKLPYRKFKKNMNFLFVKRSLPLAVRSYSVFHSTRVSSNIFSDAIGQFASKRAESSKGIAVLFLS